MDDVIVIGSRVLVSPLDDETTTSGIILPQTVKKDVTRGYVVKVGPGYAIPDFKVSQIEEDWKRRDDQPQFVPLQIKPGDIAVYLKDHAVDVKIDNKNYAIVPQDSILFVKRVL
jgi:chaperonin GroES